MSSLSKSMATFKIHRDDENIIPLDKPKENPCNLQKRTVLGVININNENEADRNQKSGSELLKLKTSLEECRIKKPEPEKAKENISNKVVAKRSPLKETVPKQTSQQTKQISKYGSPMSVDSSSPASKASTYATRLTMYQFCSNIAYRDDIFKYLKQLETQFRPKAYYMKRQPDVTYSMRTILVDWLVEVGEEYKLHNETLFMAVSFIDRFLSTMAVVRAKLQLLGTSAMFIAAKFEEIYPPEVTEFTYITDDTYTKKQVLRMEHLILKVLCFDLSAPTAYTFILHISSRTNLPVQIMHLATYISELCLLEADPYLDFAPSLIACGAIALATHCVGIVQIWPFDFVAITGYTLANLAPVVVHLNETYNKSFTSSHTAIKHKYNTIKYHWVSELPFKKLVIRD